MPLQPDAKGPLTFRDDHTGCTFAIEISETGTVLFAGAVDRDGRLYEPTDEERERMIQHAIAVVRATNTQA